MIQPKGYRRLHAAQYQREWRAGFPGNKQYRAQRRKRVAATLRGK